MAKKQIDRTLKIGKKEIKQSQLSPEANKQLEAIVQTEKELIDINNKLAITQTARNHYAYVLNQNLPKEAHPNKKKDILTIDGKKYDYNDMDENTINIAQSIAATNKKIADLENQIAFCKTARNAYVKALEELV